MRNWLDSNAIRAVVVIVLGMAVVDLSAWGGGVALDWRPTVARYAVAVIVAVLRILDKGTATGSMKITPP